MKPGIMTRDKSVVIANVDHFQNESVYCPYTDCDLPKLSTSSEHIIPLSLGGVNGFEIPVDAAINSKVGDELDGALANEFLWALRRTEYGTIGHSGKEPVAIVKNASYGESRRPAQARFHRKHGVDVWDAQDRKLKTGVGPIRISTSISIDLPVRFTAKVALAVGYYVYGDLFRKYVDHCQLRDVMNIDLAKIDFNKSSADIGLEHLTLRVDHYLHPISALDWKIRVLRMFCSAVNGSVVVLIPSRSSLAIGVGLLGCYLAMVNVPAKTDSFPNDEDYAWGHVVAIVDKKIKRYSWVNGLRRLVRSPT